MEAEQISSEQLQSDSVILSWVSSFIREPSQLSTSHQNVVSHFCHNINTTDLSLSLPPPPPIVVTTRESVLPIKKNLFMLQCCQSA